MRPVGTNRADRASGRGTFRAAMASRDFVVLFGAEAQSIVGDQLGRVALSYLVFVQTGSSVSTGVTYALTYLPAILGGTLLGGMADRYSRRWVMVVCDLVRAVLFTVMALPGVPLAVLALLLFLAVLLGPVFTAAEVSYLAFTLGAGPFRAASGLRMIASQVSQVLGFALGGIAVVAVGARPALAINAATFAVSALVIGLRARATPRRRRPPPGPEHGSDAGELRGLWHSQHLRSLNALSCLAGFFVVPEGLAVPFTAQIGAPEIAIGLLLATIPLGSAVGALLVVRAVPERERPQVARLMAVACGLPLVLSAILPGLALAVVCWFVSGVLAAYQVEVISAIARAIPDGARARYIAQAGALLLGAQGVGLVVFSAASRFVSPGTAIGLAGGLGSIAALAIAARPLRALRLRGVPAKARV